MTKSYSTSTENIKACLVEKLVTSRGMNPSGSLGKP